MRKFAFLIALGTGLVLFGLWLQPAASGQAKLDLAEKFTPGLRRTATIQREYTQTLETLAETEVVARSTQTLTTAAMVHEWYPALDATGRPARTVRTYRDLKRTQATEDWTKGGDPVASTSDATPNWAGVSVTLEVEGGELKVTGGAGAMNDYARASIAGDFETDLQPHRAKEVGKGWKIRGSGVEPLRDLGDAFDYEEGLVSITLKTLDAAKAEFEFSGTLKFRHKRADPDNPGQDITNLLMESTLAGSATLDAVAGRWLGRALTVESKISGKRDGQTVQGTAKLTDKRDYVWGEIIDTAPDNGVIEGQGLTEHKVYATSKIPPEHLVIGVASDKRSAIVEFDPASQKVTRTLVAFPPKVQYGNIALSPDRTKLAFSSTLNNELTLEPWNIFVLDLEAGKVNQLTPSWASGDGLIQGKALEDGEKVEIELLRGGKPWSGEFVGRLWLQGVSRPVDIDGGKDFNGKVTLEKVPAGKVRVVIVGSSIPWRESWDVLLQRPQIHDAEVWSDWIDVKKGEVLQVRLHSQRIGPIYSYFMQSWSGTGLDSICVASVDPVSAARPRYLHHLSFDKGVVKHPSPVMGEMAQHLQALVVSPSGSGSVELTYENGKLEWKFCVVGKNGHEPSQTIKSSDPRWSFDSRVQGAWARDGSAWFAAGTTRSVLSSLPDLPCVFKCDPASGGVEVIADWREITRYRVVDLTQGHSDQLYLLMADSTPERDVFQYDSATGSLRRLTSLGDVKTIASYGR